jgi:hypothetical protein
VRALSQAAAGVALAAAGAWALRLALGPWPAALILGPALWAGVVWALVRLDRRTAGVARPAPRPVERTPGAPVDQLDQARAAAMVELTDGYMRWRHQQSHPGRRGAA